jgi:hypothetical protein
MSRACAPLLLLLGAACAGPQRELCGTLSDELRAVREKSRECDVPPSSLAADSCGDTSACTGGDRKLLAAEASCVEHLPRCYDARSCRGDACADAVPGATEEWQKQLDDCRRQSAALSLACRKAISRAR